MKKFKVRLVLAVFCSILGAFSVAGCGGAGHWSPPVVLAVPDTTAPLVTTVHPLNNASGIAVNTTLTATFNEAMDPSTFATATFTLRQGDKVIPGAISYSGMTALFVPNNNLETGVAYTATITKGAHDIAGNALSNDYVWTFTRIETADVTAPTVASVVPLNNAFGVGVSGIITANFSEEMNPATFATSTFVLKKGTSLIPGAVGCAGITAVFTPGAPLEPGAVYTATITTGAKDLAGNALASDYVWTFTAGVVADVTAPRVTVVIPVNDSTGVAINTQVSATFSEAMNPDTITTTTFTLMNGTTVVAGSVTYSGFTAVFTPDVNLGANTYYTATITSGAMDLAGNALIGNQ